MAKNDEFTESYGWFHPAYRAMRAGVWEDWKKMKAGQLGMSEGEKRQAVGEATQEAGAVLQAQQADLARQNLATGPYAGAAGRNALLQRDLAESLTGATARASADVERVSQEKALAEQQAINSAMERQQQMEMQATQFWGDLLLKGFATAFGGGLGAAAAQGVSGGIGAAGKGITNLGGGE
jgi:hypothetical protein